MNINFLDLVKIGSEVKVNVNLSKDRLSSKTLEIINANPKCTVIDFKITDGKGIGLILELKNGEKEWFFENEIEILDNNGNIIKREDKIEKSFVIELLKNIKYKPTTSIKKLINPLNFSSWLIVSTKDIF